MNKPLKKHRLKNLMINELSLVTRPANQGSYVILHKHAPGTAKTFHQCLAERGVDVSKLLAHGAATRLLAKPQAPPPTQPNTKPPNGSVAGVANAKTEAERALGGYVNGWKAPGESFGQTLTRLITRRDPEVFRLYDRYLRAGGDLPSSLEMSGHA